MSAMALRQEVMDCVTELDDERTQLVLVFARSLAADKKTLSNSKTPLERQEAAKAFAELEQMDFQVKGETSLDGRAERAEALWRKYESLS